jgi:hypothetical protein
VGKHGRARQATDDDIIGRWRFACWITKATNTHSQYVTLIDLQRRKWLRERASISRYTCIVTDCDRILLLIYGAFYTKVSQTFWYSEPVTKTHESCSPPPPKLSQLAHCLATSRGSILKLEYLLIGNIFKCTNIIMQT